MHDILGQSTMFAIGIVGIAGLTSAQRLPGGTSLILTSGCRGSQALISAMILSLELRVAYPCSRGLPPNQPMEMLHQRSQYIVEVIASDNNIQIHLRKWMNFQFPFVLPALTAALLISQDIYLVTYNKTKATRNKTIITRTQLSDNRLSWSGSHLVQLLG